MNQPHQQEHPLGGRGRLEIAIWNINNKETLNGQAICLFSSHTEAHTGGVMVGRAGQVAGKEPATASPLYPYRVNPWEK